MAKTKTTKQVATQAPWHSLGFKLPSLIGSLDKIGIDNILHFVNNILPDENGDFPSFEEFLSKQEEHVQAFAGNIKLSLSGEESAPYEGDFHPSTDALMRALYVAAEQVCAIAKIQGMSLYDDEGIGLSQEFSKLRIDLFKQGPNAIKDKFKEFSKADKAIAEPIQALAERVASGFEEELDEIERFLRAIVFNGAVVPGVAKMRVQKITANYDAFIEQYTALNRAYKVLFSDELDDGVLDAPDQSLDEHLAKMLKTIDAWKVAKKKNKKGTQGAPSASLPESLEIERVTKPDSYIAALQSSLAKGEDVLVAVRAEHEIQTERSARLEEEIQAHREHIELYEHVIPEHIQGLARISPKFNYAVRILEKMDAKPEDLPQLPNMPGDFSKASVDSEEIDAKIERLSNGIISSLEEAHSNIPDEVIDNDAIQALLTQRDEKLVGVQADIQALRTLLLQNEEQKTLCDMLADKDVRLEAYENEVKHALEMRQNIVQSVGLS